VIYDEDSHFGSVYVIDTDQYQQPELLSSQRIDSDTFSDLSAEQRTKRLASLNIQNVFLKKTGFITINQHELDVSAECKPRRLKVNYILEDLKPLVEARIKELLRLDISHILTGLN